MNIQTLIIHPNVMLNPTFGSSLVETPMKFILMISEISVPSLKIKVTFNQCSSYKRDQVSSEDVD